MNHLKQMSETEVVIIGFCGCVEVLEVDYELGFSPAPGHDPS